MKKNLLIILFPMLVFSQNAKNSCATLFQINKLIQEKHYKPKPINDSLSVYVFETFLEMLDSDNSLFLNSEINNLKKHKFKIDNYLKDQNCNFLDDFSTAYKKAIERNSSIIMEVSKEPIVYSSKEFIRFQDKNFPYSNSEIELKKQFKKEMLFEILSEISQTSSNKDSIVNNFSKIAEASKIKILENLNCELKREKLSNDDFYSLFINAFCSYFDPHTMYFSSTEKSDFLSGLSSSNYSFGMNFTLNKKNELSIEEIIPYGAAYFSDKIETDDVLQKIKINGTEFNLSCNNFKETYSSLNSNDTKKATFTFRKKSGEIYTVELSKQLMRDIQNSVYSYILENEKKRTGYIKIPSFYSKFENGKTNVSDDVKREIKKLNDSKINTLIIDLANNGGGSMQEAMNLCGFFIKAPVIGQGKYANNQEFLYPNENAKPIFNGTIVILINGYSASASEFFANAMQDYNMAIVVGTKSFGKASMQEIFEIENESKDFLKITTGTFYRVTGKSHQANGIEPNINIPTIFEDQIDNEKKSKQALKNEKIRGFIESKSYPLNENTKNTINQYKVQSQKNPTYQKIAQLKKRVNKLFGENISPVELNFNSIFDYYKAYYKLWEDLEKYGKTEYKIAILNNEYDLEKNKKDESIADKTKIGVKNIKTSFTINEALKIINNCN